MKLGFVLFVAAPVLLLSTGKALAQSSGSTIPDTTIRVQSSTVLVPTLVEQKNGDIVYGLGVKDFQLYDDGALQKLRVDEEMDTAPVSIVVAIETGRSSALQFERIRRVASLLDLFLQDGKSDAALITFDSQARMVQDFTRDAEVIDSHIRELQPGDGGAAIYDAAAFALDQLSDRSPERRRVLLLISETRDHGSRNVKVDELVKKIGASNTLVVSLAFGAAKSELLDDLKHGGAGGSSANLMTVLMMAVNAARKNVAKEVATMSGGEYAPFSTERTFEEHLHTISQHARNRYLLSFSPANAAPGLHPLTVKLTRDIDARIVTRANYWAESSTDNR